MKSHEWTFAKVGTTVHNNIFEVLTAGWLSYPYSWLPTVLFYLHRGRGTSEVVNMFSWGGGGRPMACHFANARVEMAKFVCSASKTIFYQPVDPDRVISNHRYSQIAAMSAAVIWQFAGWISPIPLRAEVRLIISISTDYIPSLLTKYGVYNADKYFIRNK